MLTSSHSFTKHKAVSHLTVGRRKLRNFPEQIAEHMAEGLRKAGLRIPAQPPWKAARSS